MSESLPHSAIYFGDARDHWWNEDYLELCARRLGLDRFQRVLDVGCGYGHWTRSLLPHLASDVAVTGIDPEARSLAEARVRTEAFARDRALSATIAWREAHVESLPFADGSFELVTAQTVLIHVRDVGVAVDELHRVLAPGGLLLVAEPDNLANAAAQIFDRPDGDFERTLALYGLEARIQSGKAALGEGHNSAGEYLLRHLDAGRFTEVRTWINDRPYPLLPPYPTDSMRAEIAELRAFADKGWYHRPPDEALRYYLAGGGDAESFERLWGRGLEAERERLAAIDAGTYAWGGGGVMHLIAATRR